MIGQAQDCGCCDAEPACQKTRKKLVLVDVSKEVCRLKRVCVTDECGCSKKKLIRVSECVTRKKLACVDVPVDPCKKSCFAKLCDKLKAKCHKNDCCDPCDTCGCDSGCGCEAGGGVSYPTNVYPTESYPTEMSYPTDAPGEASSIMVPSG